MLSPVLTNLVLARKQRGCLRLINCYIGRCYGRCPYPQFLKKLSKLFWEDNLALAKFQCPIDTPLNYNLPQLKNLNFKIWQIPLQSLFVAVSVITKIIYSVKAYTVIFPVIGICIAVPRGGNSGKVRMFAVR